MTKLQAVNEMLEAIGIPPVTALDTGGVSPHAEAETILDRETSRVQMRGWSYNTLDEKTYTPAGDSTISLASVLKFAASSSGDAYVIRDSKLYDRANDVNTFASNVTLTGVVELLDLDTIPEVFAEYIVKSATLAFVRYKKQDRSEDGRFADAAHMAKRDAYMEDGRQSGVNLTQTDEAQSARGGRQ